MGEVARMDNLKMRPLSSEVYAKVKHRAALRSLSYPEKVEMVVELQKRVAPIYAKRNKIIVPWSLGRTST